MAEHETPRFSLRRWSQRKREASRKDASAPAQRAEAAPAARRPAGAEPSGMQAPSQLEPASPTGVAPVPAAAPRAKPADASLPPVESLTIDSDFTPFMQAGVDPDVKRAALRKLLRDPRFNVMDGLDVYIDDYSKPDPIDPAIVRTLMQARYIFAPPKTRVNEQGYVEDVPDEAAAAEPVSEPAPLPPANEHVSAETNPAESNASDAAPARETIARRNVPESQ